MDALIRTIQIASSLRKGGTLHRLSGAVLLAVMMLASSGFGQNLNNNGGTINNLGTIRVKGNASSLPPVDGVFEYNGDDQFVSATQYRNLHLTGTGIKTTTGGNFTVLQNIVIVPAATLQVEMGANIILMGNLIENGYLSGSISKTVDLSGGTTTSNYGNIGLTLGWFGTAPDTTTVKRVSGIASTGNGNQSILRYYDIVPKVNSNLDIDVVFAYANSELNGLDENTLELWRSVDGGVTWRRQGGTVNTVMRTITLTGVKSLSRWTASDVTNPLGSTAFEWVASQADSTSGGGQSGSPGSALAPFVVTVTDAYGNPIAGVNVVFALSLQPPGATGANLSVLNATTDANGQVSTVLTLGNLDGVYTVTATSAGLAGSPISFSATATGSSLIASSIVKLSGDAQQDTVNNMLSPFTVRVLTSGGDPVPGVPVEFAIAGTPLNATGQSLSVDSAITDANGEASTILTLGNKVGEYTVTATPTPDTLTGSPLAFTATATNGIATTMLLVVGNNQSGTVGQPLAEPFSVAVQDAGGNSVPNHTVNFAITQTPAGATGQLLSDEAVMTDSNGIATSILTLGSENGAYTVTATSTGLANSPVTFTATASGAVATVMQLVSGDDQSATVLTPLPDSLVVVLLSAGGNPIAGDTVTFAIESIPTGASGQLLSTTNAVTNTNGIVSTRLTLGNKVGQYTVTATSSGLAGSPVTISATAVPGNPASVVLVSGDNQQKPVGTTLDTAFVVRVLDAEQNTVPNATVAFAITSTPEGATGQALSADTVVTNAAGEASTVLTLGSVMGEYQVTASVQGASSVVFTARTSIVVGDPNRDANINIADLTQVIDHVIGKTMLTGSDSVQADVNRDSTIDILDVEMIKQHLLGATQLFEGPSASVLAKTNQISLKVRGIAAIVEGEFEPTDFGLRFLLRNDVPVKGIQIVLRFNTLPPADLGNAAIAFGRASAMAIPIHVSGNEVRLVASNNQNTPIEPGSGAIFRLPPQLASLDNVDEMELIISTGEVVHQAVSGPIQISPVKTVPLSFKLEQNFPNPFNPNTTIEFEVPDSPTGFTPVTIEVFNQLGAKVRTLVVREYEAGKHRVIWNGTDEDGSPSASGTYYYRLVSGSFRSAKKMLLLK